MDNFYNHFYLVLLSIQSLRPGSIGSFPRQNSGVKNPAVGLINPQKPYINQTPESRLEFLKPPSALLHIFFTIQRLQTYTRKTLSQTLLKKIKPEPAL
jgi:hypothetical protein